MEGGGWVTVCVSQGTSDWWRLCGLSSDQTISLSSSPPPAPSKKFLP